MVIALALWAAVVVLQEPAADDPFQEKVLATAPAGGAFRFFSVAPLTGRLAFVVKIGGEEIAFIDGKEAVRSPEIYPIQWSADGKRWACVVKEGDQRLVVSDGVRGEPALLILHLLFSPDGRRLAYVMANRDKKQAVVIDGVRQKEVERADYLAFSGNGARFGYVASRREDSQVIIDGAGSAAVSGFVGNLRFSADGNRVAYVHHSQEGAFMVVDNRPSKRYAQVMQPVFSPVGSRLAYAADGDGKQVLVVDDKEVEAAESGTISYDSVCFSPDGLRVAWHVESNSKDPYVIIDGRKQAAFQFANFPMVFSPDGKRLGYIGHEGSVMLGIADGKPIRVGEVALSRLYFSPDGNHTAFVTRDRNFRQFLVVDGKPGPGYDEVRDPLFSPDSSKCVYVARTGGELRRRVFVESAAPPKTASQLPPPAAASATADPLPQGFRSRIGSGRLFHTQYNTGKVAFSPDGRYVGSTGQQGIRIWQVDNGQEVRTFGKGGSQFAISPDGKILASAGARDRTAYLWEFETGRPLHVLEGHSGEIKTLAFSPDSKQLLTATHGPDTRLWDVALGKEIFQLPRHGQYVPLAVFSSDGKTLYTVPSLKASVFAWNSADGTAIREIPGVQPSFMKTWISRRGQFLATTKQEFPDRHYRIVITELGTGKEASTIDIGQEDAQDVAWSGDDRLLAVATWKEVSLRVRETGRVLCAFSASNVREIDLSHDGKLIATSHQGFVRLWDAMTGKERSTERHAGGITSIVYSRDGETIATAGSDQTVRLWSVTGAKQIASLGEHASTPYRPAFLAGGKQLATIDGEKGIRIWDAADGKEVRSIPVKFQSGAGPIGAHVLAISPDEKKAAVYWTDRGGWLLMVDLETGKTLVEGTSKGLLNEGTMESLSKFTFSADGKTIVSGGYGTTVVVWNAETAKSWFKFSAGTKVSAGPLLSPDGTKILTGGEGGALKSWDVATGKPAGALQVHNNGMSAAAFSPNGSILATWGYDRMLKFWNWSTGKELGTPIPVQDQINAMTFSPDGKSLAVGGADGTILLADVPTAGGK